ncbi:hypothetical protein HPB48_015185 [Haemaphysalis longicornis]|uniref:Platelet-derived growth factor (PDGF) family profile domain-containing protein n=1 Tax=Haemaphysalis longicornis TaxID=44386 RepID=A0A9J6FLF7_HAELO|nr:hypothetical protein HPB48_015185 [Haemaphysalis longicornis]
MDGADRPVRLLRRGTVPAAQDVRRPRHDILAREHERRVLQDAPCKFPQQRTICLNETSSKKYVPHCTLLHRCAPDTGCCATEEEHCQPKTIKNITLHFLVHGPHGGEQRTKVETLVFDNHTECECRAKYDHIR